MSRWSLSVQPRQGHVIDEGIWRVDEREHRSHGEMGLRRKQRRASIHVVAGWMGNNAG